MQYLVAYLGVGLFLATVALLHGQFTSDKPYVGAFVTVFLWPLVLLVAPEPFFRSFPKIKDDISSPEDPLKEKMTEILQTCGAYLSEQEKVRLSLVAEHGQSQISFFRDLSRFEDILSKFWDSNIPPEIYHSYNRAVSHLDENYEPEIHAVYSIRPGWDNSRSPGWDIGFSTEFVKSISKVDRKKKGRILEAIYKIAASPKEVAGDTIMPLTGKLSGLWRVRLGDDRLVYFPDTRARKVVLISFSSRGEVYE